MKSLLLMPLAFPVILVAQSAADLPAQDCGDYNRVVYSSPSVVELDGRVEVSTESASVAVASASPVEYKSPHGTATLVLAEPDTSVEGPWETVAVIRGNLARPLDLAVTFSDHASYGVRTDWLNEKLVWFQVWWGRIVATDLILDVDRGTLIYAEESNFGRLVLPCDQKKDLAETKEDDK